MRKLVFAACLGLVSMLSACAVEDGVDAPEEAAIGDEEAALSSDNRDTESELRSNADVEALAGCVHIRWCDEPNSPWGTICAVDNWSCSWEQIGNECAVDARWVCGRPLPPVDIRD
jgi:hypothetical protein